MSLALHATPARPYRAPVSLCGSLCLLMAFGCAGIPGQSVHSLETEISIPSCDCYYTLDCQGPGFTPDAHRGMSICERNWHASSVCSEDNFESNTKYLDGLCRQLVISEEHFPAAVQSLEAWLLAYEAGGRAGGPPDAGLVRAAHNQPLTDPEHRAIRSLVFHILSLALGLTSYPDGIPHARGFFTMPVSKSRSDDPAALDSHGQIARLTDTYRGALTLIREGLIGELTAPHTHQLGNALSHLRRRYPRYTPFTRCEFPHPPSHGHLFPYSDGIACLEEELRVIGSALRPVIH